MKRWILVVLILGAGAVAWFLFFRGKPDTDSYRFVTVERGTIESVVSSTGTLRATSTIQVGTQVSGRIEAIYVDFNDQVEEGQLIARIDPTLLEQEVRSAKIAVERSRAELDQATREMKRAQDLHDGNVITESEYTTAQYQLALAKASHESARINLDKAERNLNYTEIRAPVDGTVLERNVEIGQTVAASLQAPQLFLIAGDLSEMEILAYVDESDIGEIGPDQEVRFTVQAFPDRSFEGKVRQVRLQSTTQENVVNYMVAVAVDNKDGRLLPGMTATVEFIVQRAEDVLMVSNAALRFQPTEAMRDEIRKRRVGAGPREEGPDSTVHLGRGRRGNAGGDPDSGGRTAGWSSGERSSRSEQTRGADGGILWTVDADGSLDIIPVRTGISDGLSTEIRGPKVTEGLEVIAAATTSVGTGINNPFDRQDQRGPGRRPRPGF
jgi:HlyD family secretion protein